MSDDDELIQWVLMVGSLVSINDELILRVLMVGSFSEC